MKSERLDVITTLPQPIIEAILCLLPIEEATRTSILSREWRYKWTTIPKLEFSQSHVKISAEEKQLSLSDRNKSLSHKFARKNKDMRCKLFSAVHQVLLQRQGPVHDFALSMSALTSFEHDQIILHLWRNHTLKKLTLNFNFSGSDWYGLPVCVFSLRHLTDLCLKSCTINHNLIFNGFDSLTRLSLSYIRISKETLLHLLSNCPSLKIFSLILFEEDFLGDEKLNILELFKCLPVIEHLTTWGPTIPLLIQDLVPRELSTSLIYLKYFYMKQIVFGDGYGLPFLCILIEYSPNLEKIKLELAGDEYCDEIEPDKLEEYLLEKYSDVWLEHLNELEIEYFENSKLGMEFVKFIMVRSPNLKKVILRLFRVEKNEELKMLDVLLRAPHASSVAFIVRNPSEDDDDDDDNVDEDEDEDDDGEGEDD